MADIAERLSRTPVGMVPVGGFNTTDRTLLDSEEVATARQAKGAADGGWVEIGGRLRLGFTVRPTPRLTWRFEPGDAAGSSLAIDEPVGIRCRLPHTRELELGRTDTGRMLAAATSLSGLLPNCEPEGGVDVVDVRFSVLNWGDVFGTSTIRDGESRSVWTGRHQWSSDGWQITLDADPDLMQKWNDAKGDRGFLVSHCGRLTRTDGQPFRFSDAIEVLGCLHWLLSFVRGRRVGVALASGFADDPGHQSQQEPLITHWDVTQVDEAAEARSWFTRDIGDELDGLFNSFHDIWRNDQPLARQLRFMISAYCVTLDQSIPIDMQVVSGYIGLETETVKNLDKKELKAILTRNGLQDRISDTRHGSGQAFSGSKLLAKTRNEIVHHITGPYLTLGRLSRATETCLYFLELLILRKLGHEGTFWDRFHATWVGTRRDMPPADDSHHESISGPSPATDSQ